MGRNSSDSPTVKKNEFPKSCLILSLKSTFQTVIPDNFLYELMFYTTFLQTFIPESLFSQTVVPESLHWKLSFQTTFFANYRFSHTTLLAQCHSGQFLFCKLSFQTNFFVIHTNRRSKPTIYFRCLLFAFGIPDNVLQFVLTDTPSVRNMPSWSCNQ